MNRLRFNHINFLKILQKKPIQRQQFARRHFFKNMDSVDLHPPHVIRGMTKLNRNAFQKEIQVPTLMVSEEISNKVLPIIKKFLLKMEHLKPIRTVPCNGVTQSKNCKQILLHPVAIKDWDSMPKELYNHGIDEKNFSYETIQLTYENWRADEIFKFILPEDQEGLTSFSRIGHIVHVNLRDHLLPYKEVIGEVLKDKTVGCRTVVNKAQTIDNTYRNFNLELLCGEEDYKVEVKEHGCVFEFDFSKVYWNPRLSTEHDRIVNLLNHGDVLYDVFAGVGPFSIPAAKKKKCEVLANDLNPESFKWLNVNVKRNKCANLIQTFNKDGRQFIREDIKMDLLKRWKNPIDSNKNPTNIHITMNLPAMAIEFIDAFKNLFTNDELNEIIEISKDINSLPLPTVYVYSFSKEVNPKEGFKEAIKKSFEIYPFTDDSHFEMHFVRNVAPNKDMYRISFKLIKEILFETFSLNETKKRSLLDSVVDSSDCKIKKICE